MLGKQTRPLSFPNLLQGGFQIPPLFGGTIKEFWGVDAILFEDKEPR